jgi:hypothetical protein
MEISLERVSENVFTLQTWPETDLRPCFQATSNAWPENMVLGRS